MLDSTMLQRLKTFPSDLQEGIRMCRIFINEYYDHTPAGYGYLYAVKVMSSASRMSQVGLAQV
jgi:hypothetical protein